MTTPARLREVASFLGDASERMVKIATHAAERIEQLERERIEAADEIDRLTSELATERAALEVASELSESYRVERDAALARAESAERELERWRHGQQIEGDYVCPDSLAMSEALARAERAEMRIAWYRLAEVAGDLDFENELCVCGHTGEWHESDGETHVCAAYELTHAPHGHEPTRDCSCSQFVAKGLPPHCDWCGASLVSGCTCNATCSACGHDLAAHNALPRDGDPTCCGDPLGHTDSADACACTAFVAATEGRDG